MTNYTLRHGWLLGLALLACPSDSSDSTGATDTVVAHDTVVDTASPDVPVVADAAVADVSTPDAPPVDTETPDVQAPDLALVDGSSDDLGTPDASAADVAPDTLPMDTFVTDVGVTDVGVTDVGECVAEGGFVPVVPNAPECCDGLAAIGCDGLDGDGMCTEPCVGASICAKCGDDTCGPGENKCNCPADCDTAMCVEAGGSVPVVPNAPECCAGLAPISCDAPDGGGNCMGGCVGASICADCGNTTCDAGENHCNCPADCSAP